MLLLVNVHRMPPPASPVLDFPYLARAQRIASSRCSQRYARLERQVVDQPLGLRDKWIAAAGTTTLQFEAAWLSGGIDVGQIAQLRRDDALVFRRVVVADDELEYRDAVARTALGLPSVGHVQDVGEVDLVVFARRVAVLIMREIDDQLAALRRPYLD